MVRNNRGFSLVELMVVVAIIGILSAIAIPSVNKYMARARQTEAKTNLASVYTANKAFFAEFNSYTGIFEIIGYAPEGKLRYNVGFAGAGVVYATLVANSGYTGANPATTSVDTIAYCPTATAAGACRMLAEGSGANGALPGTAVVTPTTFVAAASGRIRQGGGVSDQWTINQNKDLLNPVDGIQ